jgi:hypothetical protein
MTSCQGAVEMRGEGVLASTWWFWKVCVDRESGMPEGPESGKKGDVFTYIYIYCMHREIPALPLELCYTRSIDHDKACIQMVT